MKNVLILVVLALLVATGAKANLNTMFGNNSNARVLISIGSDALVKFKQIENKKLDFITKFKRGDVSFIDISKGSLDKLHLFMHTNLNRCAGFMPYDSMAEAQAEILMQDSNKNNFMTSLVDYSINKNDLVNSYINQVDDINILHDIQTMSKFKNRFYMSKYGVDSQAWLKSRWEDLVKNRKDASVKYFKHRRWRQPSVILTIKGKSDEVIIIGGHADSIAGYWRRKESIAPGADDNASGIATITEIIRIIVDNDYVPAKTLKFMGYAAEEVGLLGSREIANSFMKKNVNVLGVLQFDMTNFNGSKFDIVMMKDYTSQKQNEFLGNIIDTYLPSLSWGYDTCGYACSDHASWTQAGYPSSIPFEATMKGMNHKIHTSKDTLSQSDNSTIHAEKFAKLGLAYLLELDK